MRSSFISRRITGTGSEGVGNCGSGSVVVAARVSAAVEMTGNHQQDGRGREACGHGYDPVDKTSNDLRTLGLQRRITLARQRIRSSSDQDIESSP